MARGREQFSKFKPLIIFLSKISSILPRNIQLKLLIHYRKKAGNIGLVIRYALLKNLAKYVGDNVSIQPDVYLFNVHNLSLGDNVSIHPMAYIEAFGGVTIGNDVSIAHGATIMSVTHNFSDIDIPIKDQDVTKQPTMIEDNVWIGAKASILGGNVIASGSIVGAGSVVTKNVQSNTVVAGVPARVIKFREGEK